MSRRAATGRRELETRIGYEFADKSLLDSALTHISALSGKSRSNSYQRLEFLGDHVLGLAVSDMLFRAFVKADEGELSRRLADLCSQGGLCWQQHRSRLRHQARRLRGQRGRTATHRHPGRRPRGAGRRVFLDGGGGGQPVEAVGERLRTPRGALRDPKTVLQEWRRRGPADAVLAAICLHRAPS
jgi:ribonuclease-3